MSLVLVDESKSHKVGGCTKFVKNHILLTTIFVLVVIAVAVGLPLGIINSRAAAAAGSSPSPSNPDATAVWNVDSSGRITKNGNVVNIRGFAVTCMEYILRGIGT